MSWVFGCKLFPESLLRTVSLADLDVGCVRSNPRCYGVLRPPVQLIFVSDRFSLARWNVLYKSAFLTAKVAENALYSSCIYHATAFPPSTGVARPVSKRFKLVRQSSGTASKKAITSVNDTSSKWES